MAIERAERATAIVITLLALALHASRFVHAGPLWRDESGAAHLAASHFATIVAKHESFPPPFFFIVRAWTTVAGGSDASLRLFGLTVGVAFLSVIWWSVRKTAGTVPLLALALVAINPSFVVYGDSIRGYGLGTAAAVAAFGAFARLTVRPDRRAVVVAAATSIASVQVLFLNVPLLLALGVAAIGVGLVRRRPQVALAVTAVGAAAVLSVVVWIEPMLATRAWSALITVRTGPSEIFEEMARTASAEVPQVLCAWIFLLALSLVPLPAREGSDEQRRDARLFALLAWPALLLTHAYFLETLSYAPRPWYDLAVLAAVAAALDVRFSASHLSRAIRLVVAILVVLSIIVPAMTLARVRMSNVDRIAERISADAAPGDLAVVVPWYIGVSYGRYAQDSPRWMTVPEVADHGIHRFDLLGERLREPDPIHDVLDAVEQTLRSGHRIWVTANSEVVSAGAPLSALDLHAWSPGEGRTPLSRACLRFGAFLRDHAARAERVPVASNDLVSDEERLELLMFSGWRS